ncbi:unnamed protein product [Ostreobium quekettii]|uniref:Uncharacterized protein n=1 Tax=Ostreobium quekettii TaxID=121088 RepID=A0A8S1ISF1_9CHLO|nr:unnamed protein product [Ostreobium quekettii]
MHTAPGFNSHMGVQGHLFHVPSVCPVETDGKSRKTVPVLSTTGMGDRRSMCMVQRKIQDSRFGRRVQLLLQCLGQLAAVVGCMDVFSDVALPAHRSTGMDNKTHGWL